MVGYLGFSVDPDTALDVVMESEETLSVTVTGTVHRVEETDSGVQVILTDTEVLWEGEVLETHGLLVQEEDGCSLNLESLLPGNVIQVTGTLSAFSDATNPGQFSYRDYYRVNGIDYLVEVTGGHVTNDRSFVLSVLASEIRTLLGRGINAAAADEDEAALFRALILGDKGDLTDEIRALYEVGGITHLLSISGLHLSLIGLGLWRLLRRVGLSMPAAGTAAGLVLLAYILLIGGGASAWRALIMFCTMLGARMLGRTYDLLSALGLAGLLILLEQPLYIFQAGFQLSFAAMVGIGFIFPEMTVWCGIESEENDADGKKSRAALSAAGGAAKRALLFSGSIQIATLPLVAWHYYTAPVYGILINLVAVPLMSTALASALAGTLLGILWTPAGMLAAMPAHAIFLLYELLCRLAEMLPGSLIVLGRPSAWQIALYYCFLGTATLLLSQRRRRLSGKETLWEKGRRRLRPYSALCSARLPIRKARPNLRLLLCIGVYMLSFLFLSPIPEPGLGITCLDVGQGDCTVLLLPDGTACLVDGGSSNLNSAGEDRILPYLQYEGIRRVEMIFLTHADEDHTNAITEVLTDSSITVGGLAVPAASADEEGWEELLSAAQEEEVPIYYLQTGDVWRKGEMTLTCLHPGADYEADDANAASLVLLLKYRNFTGLLTGDIGTDEEELLSELLTDVDWLKVAHHGSRYSTGEEFLSRVLPEIATISCSATNIYGHPHADTLERLSAVGSTVFITAEEGAVLLRVGKDQVKIRLWGSGERYFLPLSQAVESS